MSDVLVFCCEMRPLILRGLTVCFEPGFIYRYHKNKKTVIRIVISLLSMVTRGQGQASDPVSPTSVDTSRNSRRPRLGGDREERGEEELHERGAECADSLCGGPDRKRGEPDRRRIIFPRFVAEKAN